MRLYLALGLKLENVVVFDIKGVINARAHRSGRSADAICHQRPMTTLAEAMEGADVFLGLSAANVLPPELLLRMADNPIVFALANPEPRD